MSKNYESEFTQFLKSYKKEHPDVEKRQREGRARLWDKTQDPELIDSFKQAHVAQRPYVYQND
jgi:putative IMPACT (imprinted ancient) family translation regulator